MKMRLRNMYYMSYQKNKTWDSILQCQNFEDGMQGPQEINLLVLENMARRKQETIKQDSKEEVLALNAGELNNHKEKFFKVMCNTCVKYGHK